MDPGDGCQEVNVGVRLEHLTGGREGRGSHHVMTPVSRTKLV